MKVLITGGAGFIGSAVVRLAVAQGHEVINLDALTYAANLENLNSVAHSPFTYSHNLTSATAPALITFLARITLIWLCIWLLKAM